METLYLLPCECGKDILVETRQAGDRVRCECGLEQEVPPLRRIRHLPQAQPATATTGSRGSSSSWGFRQGFLTAGSLIAILLLAGGMYFWLNEPAPPEDFNPEMFVQQADARIDAWTPAEAFQAWVFAYRPTLTKELQPMVNPNEESIYAAIDQSRLYRNILLGAAAAVAILSLTIYASTTN